MHTDSKGFRLPTAPSHWPFGRALVPTSPPKPMEDAPF